MWGFVDLTGPQCSLPSWPSLSNRTPPFYSPRLPTIGRLPFPRLKRSFSNDPRLVRLLSLSLFTSWCFHRPCSWSEILSPSLYPPVAFFTTKSVHVDIPLEWLWPGVVLLSPLTPNATARNRLSHVDIPEWLFGMVHFVPFVAF
ncbi:hypothetical protein TNCT_115991 [Trichonephila clavata]|uniref:Uncharacterized protein n=1 Tax=Trichonephila clavata TaxID=2740835 RepID=A0A8X6HMA1_TRICU|nr:hypothetical protein TNCT_115991 [Trichonephila clavata]